MPLEILPVTSESDLQEFCQCFLDSFLNPFHPAVRIHIPYFGDDPVSKAKELEFVTNSYLETFRSKPNSRWYKVCDTDTGAIVSGSIWIIFEENPYKTPGASVATWYPEGPKREFFSRCMLRNRGPRYKYMARPHLYLQLLFTVPGWRRKGAATLSMVKGLELADSMQLQCWVNASDLGSGVYRKWGFVVIEAFDLKPETESLTESEKEFAATIEDMPMIYLWRPPGGVLEEGTLKPWE